MTRVFILLDMNFRGVTNMLRFPLCTCWLCVNYSNSIMLLSNLYAHIYILCIDFILTYVTGA
ncbi:hypothetical protein HanRHA438_Chr03g0117251 [Helianthus annuus]|nr:hypothetical protein HanRHA438_Chr03g0117251 [Helianthus annuus]